MGPDKGLCCTVYEMPNCNDNGWQSESGFHYPGIPQYGHSHFLATQGMGDEGPVSVKCKFQSENDCPTK